MSRNNVQLRSKYLHGGIYRGNCSLSAVLKVGRPWFTAVQCNGCIIPMDMFMLWVDRLTDASNNGNNTTAATKLNSENKTNVPFDNSSLLFEQRDRSGEGRGAVRGKGTGRGNQKGGEDSTKLHGGLFFRYIIVSKVSKFQLCDVCDGWMAATTSEGRRANQFWTDVRRVEPRWSCEQITFSCPGC